MSNPVLISVMLMWGAACLLVAWLLHGRLRAQLATRQVELEGELAAAVLRRDGVEQQLNEQLAKSNQLAAQLEVARQQGVADSVSRAQIEERLSQFTALREQLQQLEQQLNTERSAHGNTRDLLSNAHAEASRLEERLATLPALSAKMVTAEQAQQDLAGQLATLREEHSAVRAAHEVLTLARDESAEQLKRVQAQLLEQSNALMAVQQERATLLERVEALTPLGEQLAGVQQQLMASRTELAGAREEGAAAQSSLEAQKSVVADLVQRLDQTRVARERAETELRTVSSELTALQTQQSADREHAEQQLRLLEEARKAMGVQFENLAQQIFEAKGQRFAEQNQQSLGNLLTPLREQLTDFKTRVEQVYVDEGKGRSELKSQVEMLANLNKTLRDEARNLTRALRGDNKTQGDWGEFILKDLLEQLGLIPGQHFVEQPSVVREDGSQGRPDVVINLPEGRKLIVDAKVSLENYVHYVEAEDDLQREQALTAHLASVRNHLKGLSLREYQKLPGLEGIDFVLMFMPVEPAFMLATTRDRNLFKDAWDKNVLLVSPSTLMSVVRTVSHLWRQETSNRQTQAIVKCGTQLYESVVAFVGEMDLLGKRMQQAQQAFDRANHRLTSGNNNVVRKSLQLKEFGIASERQFGAQRVGLAELALPEPSAVSEDEALVPTAESV
ncbi:DNA recombination protein RmuC [Crenobacter intestini]|uniref:DNA recombination protein RmuC n=1 Tax=Crenobacter intestini TaxID=2563443 RepID=A0A4T0UNK5_9NEIS|nr:DNA recombination protein RmuC [Crenobacter intestini]TIC80320.1 DNA recombination protein RmuC [Crenobacter intestini]